MGAKGKLFIGIVLLAIGIIMGIITMLQLKSDNKSVLSFIVVDGIFIVLGLMLVVTFFSKAK
jgi:small basic protein